MSEPLKLPDELSWKQGGENPFFYAHCLAVWASLGDLVVDSVHPNEQMLQSPDKLPAVMAFRLFSEQNLIRSEHVQKVIGADESSFCMASWVDITTDWTGAKYTERRFLLRLQRYIKEAGAEQADTTDYMVGRRAVVASRLTTMADCEPQVIRSEGITDQMARSLAQVLASPQLQDRKKHVLDLRADAAQRAQTLADTLPSYGELLQGGSTNILGKVGYNGLDVEGQANASIAHLGNVHARLTQETAEPLDYTIRLGQNIVFLMSGVY